MSENMIPETQQASVLDLLLNAELPNMKHNLPRAQYYVDRLKPLLGDNAVFTLQALPYGRVNDIKRLTQEADIQIILAGCVSPDLKDPRLAQKFPIKNSEGKPMPEATTPADVVKALFNPGEIADLSLAVERLSGYRQTTITEVKNG